MARKMELLAELYGQAIRDVTANPENWMQFLRSACRNYRLPFDEQLLVYAQRPDATAVLEIEKWNTKFGRWVKRGSKGIAVFDKQAGTMGIKYYFDLSDTQESRHAQLVRPVPLWNVEEDYRGAVRETLINTFGISEETSDFTDVILKAAENAASDHLADYLTDILANRSGSFLEDLDEQGAAVEVRVMLENSIAFLTMVRCGLDTEEVLSADDFRSISQLNTPELVNLFGTATSAIGQMVLGEIASTARKQQRDEQQRVRTFAETNQEPYNQTIPTEERRQTHDQTHIQKTGRLPAAQSHRPERTDSQSGQIRIPAEEVSEGTTLRNLPKHDDARNVKPAPGGNPGSGPEPNDADYDRNGEKPESERTDESGQADGVGGKDEQHPPSSGGDRHAGTDLQVNAEKLPSLEGQISFLDRMAEEEPSAFSFDQRDGADRGKDQSSQTDEEQEALPETGTTLEDIHGDTKSEELVPAWKKTKPGNQNQISLPHPEIEQTERHQYRIQNDTLGQGGPKEKFRANLAAIQLLKTCEAEGRLAAPAEQEILSGYVGWGGLSDAFDETKTAWSKEYLELKQLLSEEEYAAARESTLTAFYTPPAVIRCMYQALESMGFQIRKYPGAFLRHRQFYRHETGSLVPVQNVWCRAGFHIRQDCRAAVPRIRHCRARV